jgi:protoporphyrinogen oxidase
MPDSDWDYIICGAGISGLYVAYKLINQNSDLKILILYDGILGGKIATQTLAVPIDNPIDSFCIEAGAAQFSRHDKLLNALITDLNLNQLVVPYQKTSIYASRISKIPTYVHFREGKDTDGYYGMLPIIQDFDIAAEFRSIFRMVKQLKISTEEQLQTTLFDLLKYQIYPYICKGYRCTYKDLSQHMKNEVRMKLIKVTRDDSVFTICNAWIALHILRQHADLTIEPDRGGMSQIITELVNFLAIKHVTIRKLHVTYIDIHDKHVKARAVQSRSFQIPHEFTGRKKIIIAMPAENLRQIAVKNKLFNHKGSPTHLIFNQITSVALVRIYAKINFHTSKLPIPLNTILVNNPINRLIPLDYDNQIYMIYADGAVARGWGKILHDQGEDNIMIVLEQHLTEIGYKCNIAWSVTHYWPNGVYYWKPRTDPLTISEAVIRDLNIVGGSFAVDQTSIEGALASCEEWIKLQ